VSVEKEPSQGGGEIGINLIKGSLEKCRSKENTKRRRRKGKKKTAVSPKRIQKPCCDATSLRRKGFLVLDQGERRCLEEISWRKKWGGAIKKGGRH